MFPQIDTSSIDTINTNTTGKISPVFDFAKGEFALADGKIQKCRDEIALKMWIDKVLRTEKGRFDIYAGTSYGVRIQDLMVGTSYSIDFVTSELRREIAAALSQNPQITGISSFECSYTGNDLLKVSFDVLTTNNQIIAQEVTYD